LYLLREYYGNSFCEELSGVTQHFIDEEIALSKAHHPLTAEHQDLHRKLLARCHDLSNKFHKDEINVDELYRFVSLEVVSGHILKEDVKHFKRGTHAQ
jgi:hemerythrin-like metal-binding protein